MFFKTNKRIIVDAYEKDEKQLFGKDDKDPFNEKIIAVNKMYGWLYNEGILKKISFEFKDYSDITHFAFDVRRLVRYKKAMLQSGIDGAELAVQHIFDEDYAPCRFCGAITLGWTMRTYRDNCGCLGSSWECENCNKLDTEAVSNIRYKKKQKGIKEAVKLSFKLLEFEPSDLEN